MSEWKICSESLQNIYKGHLGKYMDWTNKIVLDIGADWGSSAEFFIKMGAKIIYAIEGNPNRAELFKDFINAHYPNQVFLEQLFVDGPDDFIYLLSKYDFVDVVKVDIEGYEIHLASVPDDIFSIAKEYLIEYHSQEIRKRLREKLERNGYKIKEVENEFAVLYANK